MQRTNSLESNLFGSSETLDSNSQKEITILAAQLSQSTTQPNPNLLPQPKGNYLI